MLLVVTGSSCAGKTTALRALPTRPALAVHDFDEVGVPEGAGTAWRQRTMEHWVIHTMEQEQHGIDVLLTGQSPLGEVLASPSAVRLQALAVCLLDVEDEIRRVRLVDRDGYPSDSAAVTHFLRWASWHRGHAEDPQHRPDVITQSAWPAMRWHRWEHWTARDPRWAVSTIDTTRTTPETTGEALAAWVGASRAARDAGTLPLAQGWEAEARQGSGRDR